MNPLAQDTSISAVRETTNPVIYPEAEHPWKSLAAFNGSPVIYNDKIYMYYRAMPQDPLKMFGREVQLNTIGLAEASLTEPWVFGNDRQVILPELGFEQFGVEDPRVTYIDGQFVVFYTALSKFPPDPSSIRTAVAVGTQPDQLLEKHLVTPFNAKAMSLFPRKINGKYVALLTANTDIPPAIIAKAEFDTLEDIWSESYWRVWYRELATHSLPLRRMNHDQIEIGAQPIETEHGWLLLYAYIQDYTLPNRTFRVEAVMLDLDDPQKVIGRCDVSLLSPTTVYEKEGVVPDIVFPSGAVRIGDNVKLIYGAADTSTCVATLHLPDLYKHIVKYRSPLPRFQRYPHNPILLPNKSHAWEARSVFNPAAWYDGEKTHMLYRSMSLDNTSTMGYAQISGGEVVERLDHPVYVPRGQYELKKKPNGNSGAEDPRLTEIDGRLYVTYTAYDSINVPRVGMSWISRDDFLNKRWNWSDPMVISPPDVDDKDACIFPEKINGKYAIFHRINKTIVLDYTDSLEFDGTRFLHGEHKMQLRKDCWDSLKIGIAGPPHKTEDGWLLFYHGISEVDREYRVGAMLLDLEHPIEVKAQSHWPVLEPELPFERFGDVPNVVFPCGSVIVHDEIWTYYGGADSVVGAAVMKLDDLLTHLEDVVADDRFA